MHGLIGDSRYLAYILQFTPDVEKTRFSDTIVWEYFVVSSCVSTSFVSRNNHEPYLCKVEEGCLSSQRLDKASNSF